MERAGLVPGWTDIPLNSYGYEMANRLAERLRGESIAAIYTSDLGRAQSTAQAIHIHHSCPLFLEPGLREISFGRWEGLTYTEIQEREPEALSHWQTDQMQVAPPGGEMLKQFAKRVKTATGKIVSAHPEGNLLLVAHGGSLQVLLCQLLGLPSKAYWRFYLGPASLSEIRLYPEGAILNLLNDACHLKDHT